MKKMRRLIPAFAMLLVAATMLSTASFAWFTIGTQATATGMEVTAQATSSLLIIDAKGMDAAAAYTAFQTATNNAKLTKYGTAMEPATAWTTASNVTEPVSGLVTLVDANKVDNKTGATLEGATYEAATENVNYYDYVLYLAAAGSKMEVSGNKLLATVSIPADITTHINNALSIQFVVYNNKAAEAAAEPSKVQTINLKTVDAQNGNALVVDLGTTVIPAALNVGDDGAYSGLNDYVVVIMRVYYDGALVEDAATGTTYVRNEKVTTTGAGFSVTFDYKAPTT